MVNLSSGVNDIEAGEGHTCALTPSGVLKCWGRNYEGQIGDGTTTNRLTPVDVTGISTRITAIATGNAHTCALTISSEVKCWGYNNRGQLGDGTTSNRLTPVDVIGLSSGVIAITSGLDHTCALTSSGGVKCWGANDWGQIGDGSSGNGMTFAKDRPIPTDVIGLSSGVAAIATGRWHTCALTASGDIKCWGLNNWGQLGDGTIGIEYNRLTPVNVLGLSSGVTAIAAGEWHTCALTSSGGVKCWGGNDEGNIGDGTRTTRLTPVDVIGLSSGTTSISTGAWHNCVITNAGGVKCWGQNVRGQLGDGTTTGRYTPIDAVGLY